MTEFDNQALSVRQPSAYLAGVLHGDGFVTSPNGQGYRYIGLRCADRDFADAFAAAVNRLIVRRPLAKVALDGRGYWLVRRCDSTGVLVGCRELSPSADEERSAWLRGLFDSEGNAQLTKLKRGPGSFSRRIAMYSTTVFTLETARTHLGALGILCSVAPTRAHLQPSHKGNLVVHQLRLLSSRDNYLRFLEAVGSSIARKVEAMSAIVATYQPADGTHQRRSQLLGAAAKNRKRLEETVPRVIAAIAPLVAVGGPITRARLESVPGVSNLLRRHYTASQLVEMARSAT